ncbi:hypothetical protein [Falsibacillus pallidus]|uniref:Uncharacterized protein n=1 Tax=Falsibacillus pallidus TaxID=493781 RepID=A0A370GEF8_9BACI|nr:hypothetical protein [Falsibacillus pallidus]RDI42185.1 hypothetical protein DFR59_10524 [Falsibacillus pallidus]
MENNTEKQILNELQKISHALKELNEKLEEDKPSFVLWDMLKSLLIGLFIVGPGIAVVFGIFAIISAKLS